MYGSTFWFIVGFLYRLSQQQLAHTVFPLGSMTKEEVRKIDVEQGFHGAGHEESQDFYAGSYTDLLDVANQTGNIVDKTGTILGTHQGIWNYTIGQRKGLGVSSEKPLYVLALRPSTNEVLVGYEEETRQTQVIASQLHWSLYPTLDHGVELKAKIRSAGTPTLAVVHLEDDGTRLAASFNDEVKAAAVGQSLVVYDGDAIVCGGIIERTA